MRRRRPICRQSWLPMPRWRGHAMHATQRGMQHATQRNLHSASALPMKLPPLLRKKCVDKLPKPQRSRQASRPRTDELRLSCLMKPHADPRVTFVTQSARQRSWWPDPAHRAGAWMDPIPSARSDSFGQRTGSGYSRPHLGMERRTGKGRNRQARREGRRAAGRESLINRRLCGRRGH